MKKKLDTRFPAARIKKIMQADEDVGKIAQAVPVLVSKALELFLQDLCDRTYGVTLQRGAKTMSSLHLKHCVQSYNVFDFLRDIVSRVPDHGHGHVHSDATADDRSVSKRRKATGDECNDSDEESKRSRIHETSQAGSSGRGRGRGRGRSRGRGSRNIERESSHQEMEIESGMAPQPSMKNDSSPRALVDNGSVLKDPVKEDKEGGDVAGPAALNFDLNADVNENDDAKAAVTTAAAGHASSAGPTCETKHEEYPGWSLPEMDKMVIDPLQLANFSKRLDEDEDDYDEEG